MVLLNQGCQSLGVDASHNILPWLDLITSGTVSLNPKGRWDGTLVPLGACVHSCGLVRPSATEKASLFVSLTSLWSSSLTYSCVCLGEQRPTVVGMEIRDLNLKDPWVKTFGTIDGGLELMNAA